MVRELLRVGGSRAKLRVVGPDALRYSVYPDGTVYLLNTDYDCPMVAKVLAEGYEKQVVLEPLQIQKINTGIVME
jgi:hypothetical protein